MARGTKRQIKTKQERTAEGLERFVSKPPPHLLQLALELDLMREAGNRHATTHAEWQQVVKAREAFHAKLRESWPQISELIWRSLGRYSAPPPRQLRRA